MSDLDGDDEIDQSTASTRSKTWRPDFLSKIANRLKSRSQKSLNASQKSKSPHSVHESKMVNSGSTSTLAKSRECLPLISENSPYTGVAKDCGDDQRGNMQSSAGCEGRKRHISQATEDATQDALDDLRFKQDLEKGDHLPRSVSLLGQDVAHELGLDMNTPSFPVDPRYRTTSEGPKCLSNAQ